MTRYPTPDIKNLPSDIVEKILEVQEKAGFVPNVFLSLARRPAEWRAFFSYHDALMLKEDSNLTKGDREMIVTTTSAANHCLYCVIAHGAILRIYEKKPLVADQVAINLDMQEQINNLVKELQEVKSMAGKENALMTVLLAQGTEHNTIVKSIRERGNMLMADIITTFQERYETVGNLIGTVDNLIGRMEQHLAASRQAARDLQGEVAPLRRYLTQTSERAADAEMQADIAKRLAGITFYKFVEMDCVARGDVLLNSGAGMTNHLSDLARQNMDMLVESLRMLPSSQRPLDIFLGRM